MALATANEVMTHVPWSGETPRSPAMAGIDTLAIEVSSTFMKVASDSAMVPIASAEPVSGGSPAGAPPGAPPVTGLSAFSADTAFSSPKACASRRALVLQMPRRTRELRAREQGGIGRGGGGQRMHRRGLVGGYDGLHACVRQRIARAEHVRRPGRRGIGELRKARPAATVAYVHVGLHGKPDLQRVRAHLARIECDAHRHALHDLDPVAGRILGRQE